MANSEQNLRTPLALVVKTITTHAFTLASYAYVSSQLRRPMRTNIQALRILFLAFVPTLPLVEVTIHFIRAVIQFLQNYEDDDKAHLRYYLSGALGMHAQVAQDDDNKDTKDGSQNPHLLAVGSHCAENTVIPFDWAWVGKLLAALFSLTQAVGTIVMWVRRLHSNEADLLGFDHRNGAMGIASAISGVICIIVLLLRLNWKVSKSFVVPQGGYYTEQKTQFVVEAFLSMLVHLSIATIPNRGNRWLYTSAGVVYFLVVGTDRNILIGWQSILLVIFVYIFRRDIAERLGIKNDAIARFSGHRVSRRVKALVALLLILWVVADIVKLLVVDIIEVVRERKDYYFMWQDPLSDSLIVI
ncbi:hypothetical protein BCR34DRAFT_606313 [Clohesyomyces aquaticus]|uniref:Uncharacterized protein n=1 Tax=Clohesyomyces aquaticus TaxID=1231657 RepID=A0A1Y1YR75_9PLEO|nr:hypothetical protein BCR34DRAFT_606313 [Clohesyomyces aquaticus]